MPKYNNQDTFYIINMSSGGFVLVAADDNIYPVLGYSFESEMDQNSMNPAARAWLNNYSVQIESAISSGITNIQAAQEWEKQDNSDQSMDSAPLNIPSVPPLISTKWGQGTFYNTFTPLNTPVGCVAVAMAQIMKYHNFPETGTGQNAYTHDTYGVLSADFNTQYKWSKMPDQLTSQSLPEDISAVAELIYHCGISVDMDYAVSTSIASTGDVATSLYQYFGYNSSADYKIKDDYSDENWTNMLMEELNQHRPVQYRGEDAISGGHSFICDGYQGSEYFHFNWGWGGSSDGYYRLSALNASSYTFSNDQKAIFGIQPGIDYQRATELSESFENVFPETGWSQTIINDSSPSPIWSQVSIGSNPSCTPSDGTKMLQFNSYSTPDGAEARLELPSLNLTNFRYPRLIFSMYNETSNSEKNDEGITVQISENGTDWVDIRFYPRYTLTTGWKRYHLDLTYYTGKTISIGLSGHSANGSNIYLDQIVIDQTIATCLMTSDTKLSYVGVPISFTDTSLWEANSYYWNFDDTSTSTSKNITHIFTNAGLFTVTHSINDNASSITETIQILPSITPPYLITDGGDFESNPLHFSSQAIEGDINLWERGMPSNTISETASGQYVWKTDLDDDIQMYNYTCALYTPSFDFSAPGSYFIKFKYKMDTYGQLAPGAVWMEYSTNSGKIWTRLGQVTGNPENTQNWYNNTSNYVDDMCWWNGTNSYIQVIFNASEFYGTENICFRWVFKVKSGYNSLVYDVDGMAIDDFEIEYNQAIPTCLMTSETKLSYVGEAISFTDTSKWAESYLWNFGDASTSTEKNVTHFFSEPGLYTVTHSINDNASSITETIYILPSIVPPYLPEDGGDFESNPLHFVSETIEGDIDLWERGSPTNAISDTASGVNVWKTDLDSDLQKENYTCALYTPNFNFSGIGNYFIKFKYQMRVYLYLAPAAVWMEYSTNMGKTWQCLGQVNDNPEGTQNWYNDINNEVADMCWWVDKYSYVQAVYNASDFKGTPNICFRWILKVQDYPNPAIYEIDGMSIDDFEIDFQSYTPQFTENIIDQTVFENSDFTAITLDQYITDVNHSYTEITWTASGYSNFRHPDLGEDIQFNRTILIL